MRSPAIISEQEFDIPAPPTDVETLVYLESVIRTRLSREVVPIRFVVTASDATRWRCEVGVLHTNDGTLGRPFSSIFSYTPRLLSRSENFNTVFLVPTGIGAHIGGHSGDATPAARLLAEASDCLLTHPNVVNAADINEMTENTLYVEGSVICRLLMGTVGLAPVRSNRILVVIEDHRDVLFSNSAINAANAARASGGIDISHVIAMDPPLNMTIRYTQLGRAAGVVKGLSELCDHLDRYQGEYDALAITSVVDISQDLYNAYFRSSGDIVNPYGGVEAMLTHAVSSLYNIPSAHSPMYADRETCDEDVGVLDPRMAAEGVSLAAFHCVLKGLHRSPKIVTDAELMQRPGVITASDISCLVIPEGCIGLPTLAAVAQGIPVIAVRENKNVLRNSLAVLGCSDRQLYIVDNYLEAAGLVTALKAGVAPCTVRRDRDLHVTVETTRASTQTDALRQHRV